MDKIEMYFGLNRQGGRVIPNFNYFVSNQVTPKFPDGFTVLDGYGQWRNNSGQIIREPCKILVLIVESWQDTEIQSKVYTIRNRYCSDYSQESVLVTVSGLHEVSF